jgi:hypothetical protein
MKIAMELNIVVNSDQVTTFQHKGDIVHPEPLSPPYLSVNERVATAIMQSLCLATSVTLSIGSTSQFPSNVKDQLKRKRI